jgi:hypothetical protein
MGAGQAEASGLSEGQQLGQIDLPTITLLRSSVTIISFSIALLGMGRAHCELLLEDFVGTQCLQSKQLYDGAPLVLADLRDPSMGSAVPRDSGGVTSPLEGIDA